MNPYIRKHVDVLIKRRTLLREQANDLDREILRATRTESLPRCTCGQQSTDPDCPASNAGYNCAKF
jgi:hypothetical protein